MSITPRCRSPPPPFRPKKSEWRNGYGDYHTNKRTGFFSEVSVEVYTYLDQADHRDENLAHEQRRHWDMRELDEYIIANECSRVHILTPEQWLIRKETLAEIVAVLNACTEQQRQRFLLYALEGMSYEEIGRYFNCSKVAVHHSISAVRKKYQDFINQRLNETPFSG